MVFQASNRAHKDEDVIASVMRTPGKASKPRAPSSAGEVSTSEITRITKEVRKKYKRDFEVDDNTRIITAIEYLTVNYAKQLIPMPLLYWMCNPGHTLKGGQTDDVLRFTKRVSRQRTLMINRFGRSFFFKAGHIRGYISREEHAAHAFTKAADDLGRSFNKAEALRAVVGNVETLKVSTDFTAEQKDRARDIHRAVGAIGQSIKGLLGPAPVTPKK